MVDLPYASLTGSTKVGARLVRYNGYYTVIGISIIRNRISCNGIVITIHQFGNNT
jgi:hypothetical protein